ncbi:hypothetical protein C2G38_2293790 [Gigaspora rosea]|uniref:Uncharacterized protein n=1 Tax=Gigaspora rosea TaxID=44941 RepID=A0A397TWM5_9GLOM|nr:hypothetical protein C2G38_2293790 [Gigaspora rosea]
MSNDQLTINTLRELNARLASEITELRKENAEISELRKKLSEVEVENIELKAENESENQYLTSPILIGPKSSEDMEIDDFLDSTYKEKESENQYLTSPILIGPKSSEDMEIDDFLDSTYKEKVSKEIIQSIREKKLRVQEKIITSQDTKQESNIIQNHTIGISETGGPGKSNIDEASQHLAQLCDKALMLRMVQNVDTDNVGHQISSENTEISARPGKILPIPEDSSSIPAKSETNIDYDDVYFDEEFDDDVYFDDEVASRSDKILTILGTPDYIYTSKSDDKSGDSAT